MNGSISSQHSPLRVPVRDMMIVFRKVCAAGIESVPRQDAVELFIQASQLLAALPTHVFCCFGWFVGRANRTGWVLFLSGHFRQAFQARVGSFGGEPQRGPGGPLAPRSTAPRLCSPNSLHSPCCQSTVRRLREGQPVHSWRTPA